MWILIIGQGRPPLRRLRPPAVKERRRTPEEEEKALPPSGRRLDAEQAELL